MEARIKASEYVAEFIKSKVGTVFGVQGGAAVHLFDSLHKAGVEVIYCHHEQAAGFAAVAYAKIKGFGVCIVTTGPAATNCITACLGAWQDSIPVLFISGQTRVANMSYDTEERQVGSQEAPIADIVERITKCSYVVSEKDLLASILECAYREAFDDRPGPVWIDLPVDVSWASL